MPARLTAFLPDAAASCLVRSLAPLVVGRGSEAGFRIDHPSISRRHARLSWEHDRWHLLDEGSKTARVDRPRLRRVRGRFDLRDLANVRLNRQHLHTLLAANLIGSLIERVLGAGEDNEVDAFLREPLGDGFANAFAGAGDECGTAFQS